MADKHLPPHLAVGPDRFFQEFARVLSKGPIETIHSITDKGFPSEPFPVSPSITLHPFLMLCIEGTMNARISSGDSSYEVTINSYDALFFTSHTWVACDIQHAKKFVRVTFATDHTLFGMRDYTATSPHEPEYHGVLELCILPQVFDPVAIGFVSRLERSEHFGWHNERSKYLANLVLFELLDILQNGNTKQDKNGKAYHTWMAIKCYVDEHACEPLSRDMVAQLFRINPGHISRLFNRFADLPFGAYIERIRLQKACTMLDNSNLTISEIGFASGFTSVNYFIRLFHSRFGFSPGMFRNR